MYLSFRRSYIRRASISKLILAYGRSFSFIFFIFYFIGAYRKVYPAMALSILVLGFWSNLHCVFLLEYLGVDAERGH